VSRSSLLTATVVSSCLHCARYTCWCVQACAAGGMTTCGAHSWMLMVQVGGATAGVAASARLASRRWGVVNT
jgi:hypothetical protein